MPKPTDERIAAAMKPTARVSDTVALIADMRAEVDANNVEAARLEALSITVTTPEAEADAAADEASKLRRRAIRLEAKITAVDDHRRELERAAAAKARAAARAAAVARRDQLANDLRDHWPAIVDQITGLLKRIVESDAELASIAGAEIASAEAIARNCPAHFHDGLQHIKRFTDMRVPNLDASTHEAGHWPAWPPREASLP